ncbi:hypothetical protein [Streptococcus moroccensis]|uniref:YolD-like protein n=1 Tax=Streptococcus moroccensis TaxID=1451356 RepID=A0ABT9YUI7_9STRE|nr:hypothetical protein [Streptococcus moroccensis]MDQ0223267.1 hypothetical protein [Streptococcus moroccensis]
MKKIFSKFFLMLNHYINAIEHQIKGQEQGINPDILKTIRQALEAKMAVHVIYGNQHFTGTVIRFDQTKSQVVLENFKKSITLIIDLHEIKKIAVLPPRLQKIAES